MGIKETGRKLLAAVGLASAMSAEACAEQPQPEAPSSVTVADDNPALQGEGEKEMSFSSESNRRSFGNKEKADEQAREEWDSSKPKSFGARHAAEEKPSRSR